MSRRRAHGVVAAVVAAVAAGCGADGSPPAAAPAGRDPRPATTGSPQLPARIPRRATGSADRAATRVIRAWTRALRRGDIAKAATYFAIPSTVQNATPPLTLASVNEVRAFNVSLPCGAREVRAGGAGRFTIVTFKLTERVDGDCMGAAGHLARCAIRVVHGRIAEWHRLPDPPPPSAVDPGSSRA